MISRRLVFGTGVYLVPLRHPTPVAKQVSTLDHLTEGRFIFGVGVGGEFHKEFEACGVPVAERGARLDESIAVMRKLWTGKPATHDGHFFKFEGVTMQPPPRQAGGPPIWCGGRSDAALRRIGRTTDGWMSYVITPEMFRQGLEKIAAAAAKAGRVFDRGFGTSHLLFTCIDDTYEKALDAATAPSASAMGWTSARPPSAIARSARRKGSWRPSCAFTKRVSATSFSISSVLRGARPSDRALRRGGAAAAGGAAQVTHRPDATSQTNKTCRMSHTLILSS